MRTDYYEDLRWCPHCNAYVAYLQSTERAFCSQCDRPVQLMRPDQRRDLLRDDPLPRRPDRSRRTA